MTPDELKHKTDAELNVMLAELLGWKHEKTGLLRWRDPSGGLPWPNFPPQFCSDDAPRSVLANIEKGLTEHQHYDYANHLCNAAKAENDGPGTAVSKAFVASARTRAEALYLTLAP